MPEGQVGLTSPRILSYCSALYASSIMASMACSLGMSSMAAASSLFICKHPLKMAMQGIDKYRLCAAMVLIDIALFGTALGMADRLPVGRLIAGAAKTTAVNKGLGQIKRMSIGCQPIFIKPFEA